MRASTIVRRGMDKCHLTCADGSADDNIVYCSKGGAVVSWGEPVRER